MDRRQRLLISQFQRRRATLPLKSMVSGCTEPVCLIIDFPIANSSCS